MMAVFLTILVTFLVVTFFGHTFHWMLHQEWMKSVYVSHMTHHQLLYPASDFTSVTYRDAGKDSTPKFFFFAGLPIIIAPPLLWALGILPLHLMVIAMVVEVVLAFLHNYLHDAFHITGHWLYQVPVVGKLFSHWVALHYLHHVSMEVNFGIFTYMWDRLFSSYRRT